MSPPSETSDASPSDTPSKQLNVSASSFVPMAASPSSAKATGPSTTNLSVDARAFVPPSSPSPAPPADVSGHQKKITLSVAASEFVPTTSPSAPVSLNPQEGPAAEAEEEDAAVDAAQGEAEFCKYHDEEYCDGSYVVDEYGNAWPSGDYTSEEYAAALQEYAAAAAVAGAAPAYVCDSHGGFYGPDGLYYPAAAASSDATATGTVTGYHDSPYSYSYQNSCATPSASSVSDVDAAAAGALQGSWRSYTSSELADAYPQTAQYYASQQGAAAYGASYDVQGISGSDELLQDGLSSDPLQGVNLESADAAGLLKMFFPTYSDAALRRIFEASGRVIRTCFEELCLMEKEAGAAAAMSAKGGAKGSSPAAKSQQGRKQPQAAPVKQKPFKLEDSSFPTLASPAKSQPAATASPAAVNALDNAAEAAAAPQAGADAEQPLQPLQPQQQQQQVSPKPVPMTMSFAERVKAAAAAASDSTATADGKATTASGSSTNGDGVSAKPGTTSSRPITSAPAGPQRQQQHQASTSAAAGGVKGRSSVVAGMEVPWVATGSAVSAQYAELRSEARDHARVRNMCFQQATLAYLSGNKALAKELARQGRAHNDAMKAAHAAAATRTFESRNRHLAAGAGGATAKGGATANDSNATTHVDLHGLHAKEARQALEEQLERSRAAGHRTLRIITGAGNHTKGGGKGQAARLPVAVQDTLLENHVTFKLLQPGLLEAYL